MKIIQYSNLAISSFLENTDERIAKKVLRLSQTARDARIAYSNMQLFATLNGLKEMMSVPKPIPCFFDRALLFGQLVSQFGTTFYDNATLLSRNKVFNPAQEAQHDEKMSYFWTINILISMGIAYRKAKQLAPETDPKKKTKDPKQEEKLALQRKMQYIDILSNFSDLFTALAGTNLLPYYFGWNFSKPVKGLGGTVAGATGIINYKLNQKLQSMDKKI